jgi:uncharacterized protein
MMKWLLVLLVVVVVVSLLMARGGRREPPRQRRTARGEPVVMLTCAHCGVHLPQDEAVFDAAQRPFCGEAHRIAGPR